MEAVKLMNRTFTSGNSCRSQRGVTLVIILASIVTERASSSSYATNTTTRQLGDIAVSIVQAQIQQASTQAGGSIPLAWASQPGLARTFKQDGNLNTIYKLYSDAEMPGNSLDPAAIASRLASWKTDTTHFTDVNAPIGVDLDGNNSISQELYLLRLLPVHGFSVQGEWINRHSNRKRHELGQLHYLAERHGFKQSAEEPFHHPGYPLTGRVAVLRP